MQICDQRGTSAGPSNGDSRESIRVQVCEGALWIALSGEWTVPWHAWPWRGGPRRWRHRAASIRIPGQPTTVQSCAVTVCVQPHTPLQPIMACITSGHVASVFDRGFATDINRISCSKLADESSVFDRGGMGPVSTRC